MSSPSPELLALVNGIQAVIEEVRRPMYGTERVSKARDAVAMIDTLQGLVMTQHYASCDETGTHFFPHSPAAVVYWSEWAEAYDVPVDNKSALRRFVNDMEADAATVIEQGMDNGDWEPDEGDPEPESDEQKGGA